MNTNLKNGLATLGMLATSAGIVGGLGYGAYKVLAPNKKSDITVTDSAKAEQDIKTESDVSRAFFKASQNIQTGNTETTKTAEKPVADIKELCIEIAKYQCINNDIMNALKTGRINDAKFMKGTADKKELEIRKALEEVGYKKPDCPVYIDKLGNSFEEYVQKAKNDIAAIK